jgi:hypothetical protein
MERRSTGRTPRILLGALGGALACSLLMIVAQGYRWMERTPEGGGLIHNLVWLALLLFQTLFQSPWGALGALIGAAIGWLTLSSRRQAR